MKVLIAGASGRTGLRLVTKLSAQENEVFALVRNAAKARALLPPGTHIVVHDLLDYSGFNRLVQGMDVVIFAAGATAYQDFWKGSNRPRHIDFEAVRQMAMAADNNGVRKFILISSMGVSKPFNFLNLFGRVLHWKLQGENALRSTHLNYTIIRPGRLTDDGYFTEQLQIVQDDKVRYKSISRAELAEVVAQCIAYPAATRTTFEVYRRGYALPDALTSQLDELVPDEYRSAYVRETA
jgi:uncharacterized protein YbjT (DUF2867 family)